jgi:phosphoglycerate dehydrogenase-like enzyme
MRVVGVSSAEREIAGFDRVVRRADLIGAVGGFDLFVVLIPYAPETRHIIGPKVFAAMKPDSYFVNLARGGVVDEDALVHALESGQIAGAALDVFSEEPLPENHVLWRTKNVIVTPHVAGLHDGYAGHALPTVEENIRRFLAGDIANMINVVRR